MADVFQRNSRLLDLQEAIYLLLQEGREPTPDMVEERANLLATSRTATLSFEAENAEVEQREESSAVKFNTSLESAIRDLEALFATTEVLSGEAGDRFSRWKTELSHLHARATQLETRIDGLLDVARDTDGYRNFVADDFSTTEKINLQDSSVVVDLGRGIVTVGATSQATTKLQLTPSEEDIQFRILTGGATVTSAPTSSLVKLAKGTGFWQSRVAVNHPGQVVGELVIRLGTQTVEISTISLRLHAANSNSQISIIPLYSVDGFNYSQLPSGPQLISTDQVATFSFPSTEMKYVKLIMTKLGHDTVSGTSTYIYEFGADVLGFWSEGWEEEDTATFYSQPLSVIDRQTGEVVGFNRASLSSCENLPDDTSIQYFLAASTSSETSLDDLTWIPVDPRERDENRVNSSYVQFSKLDNYIVGDEDNWVKVSYDVDNNPATDPEFSNPGKSFSLVDIVDNSAEVVQSIEAGGMRYYLPSSSDRILDHQLLDDIFLDESRLAIQRNVGVKGDTSTLVRGIPAGWGYEEPYFSTTIYVASLSGMRVDLGSIPIILDGWKTLSGITTIAQGYHRVTVHKSAWLSVERGAETLAALRDLDLLYPYNQKLLFEGYSYGDDYREEQVYVGADSFCELLMKQVSPTELIHGSLDLSRYAIDMDVAEGLRPSSRVILVKTNPQIPDFSSERFCIRIDGSMGDRLFKYIWLKAILSTNNPSAAPTWTQYRIRLSK